MGLAALPRRDADARDRLEQLGVQARPMVLARERAIELGPPAGADAGGLAALVPGGALTRGSVLRVVGDAGATTVGFELAAAVTAVGEWAAVVDLDSS
ncbi:MAG: hypothetical protein ABWY80_08765, partial [Acidimicrobiia bacterium]